MITKIVKVPAGLRGAPGMAARLASREMSERDFVRDHASGSLRKAERLGFRTRKHYLEERVAFEFGGEFEVVPASRILVGEPLSEGDCKAVTKAGWYGDRYISACLFPGDRARVKYIAVERERAREEGLGLVITRTSASWVPQGHVVFAFIARRVGDGYGPARNPC